MGRGRLLCVRHGGYGPGCYSCARHDPRMLGGDTPSYYCATSNFSVAPPGILGGEPVSPYA